jgi:hypothetical protein
MEILSTPAEPESFLLLYISEIHVNKIAVSKHCAFADCVYMQLQIINVRLEKAS